MAENRPSACDEAPQHKVEVPEKQQEGEARKGRSTTFEELLQASHEMWCRPLQVGTASESTQGPIAEPRDKLCPEQLCYWADFPGKQREVFENVCRYLKPTGKAAPPLFHTLGSLDDIFKDYVAEPLRSEDDLDKYVTATVDKPVARIIRELSRIRKPRINCACPTASVFRITTAQRWRGKGVGGQSDRHAAAPTGSVLHSPNG